MKPWRAAAVATVVFSVTAPLWASAASSGRHGGGDCASVPLQFGARVPLKDAGAPALGFEPSIQIDGAGTVYVTAHKSQPATTNGHLGSWLWRSADRGRTFTSMAGPLNSQTTPYGVEGDLAVDGKDRLYFMDTYGPDNHFYRYTDHGTKLDLYRPDVATVEEDDRPWLAAQGDGFVYYLSTTVYLPGGRLTFHRSTNAGASFDPVGFTFPRSGLGELAADPRTSDVYVVADDLLYTSKGPTLGEGTSSITVWHSADRGVTWTSELINTGQDLYFPGVAVSPVDGTVYAYWTSGSRLMLAQSKNHGTTWHTLDVTPFSGTFTHQWATVGPSGDVAMTFQGQPAGSKDAYLYALTWREHGDCKAGVKCAGAASSYARLDPAPSRYQDDFFQVRVSKDNAINVAFQDDANNLYFVKQTAGPSMNGGAWCGTARSG